MQMDKQQSEEKQQRQSQFHQNEVDDDELDFSKFSSDNGNTVDEELRKMQAKLDKQSVEFRAEIEAVKADNKLSHERNNTLLAKLETMEQKLKVAELESKLAKQEVHNLVAEKVNEMAGQMEEKQRKETEQVQQKFEEQLQSLRNEMEEKDKKAEEKAGKQDRKMELMKNEAAEEAGKLWKQFNDVKAKMADEDRELTQMRAKLGKQLEEVSTELGGKIGNLESKTIDGLCKWEEMRKTVDALMNSTKLLWNNNKLHIPDHKQVRTSEDGLTILNTNDEWKTPTKDGTMQNAMYESSPSVVDEKSIFNNLKFVLTSANRPNKVPNPDFNKRKYRTKIEDCGGQVVDDFCNVQPNEIVYLIADTFYLTHKYLCALSLSISCISYTWVKECVAQSKLVDFNPFLLPSGESTLEPGQIIPWKPLKGQLFKDMCVVIYSKYVNDDPRATAFGAIWTPLMRNLGAIIVGRAPDEPFSPDQRDSTLEQKLDFCTKNKFDVLLAENDCEKELAENAQAKGALAVSSEWVIQAIVTGELPDVNASDKFRYDFA